MDITIISVIFVNFILIYLKYDYDLLSTIMESKLSLIAVVICIAAICSNKDKGKGETKKPILFFLVSVLLTFLSLTTI